jgi:type II secretory pathway pseudopilin PulG
MMISRRHRGSALLAALIVIGVLALITVATMELASISKKQSAKDARTLSQTSCVEASRQYLLGRLRVFGLDPTTIVLNQALQVETGTRNLRTGHVRDQDGGVWVGDPAAAAVTSVTAVPPNLVGNSSARNRDISNVIVPGATLGGRSYRAVVACTDPLAGDMELEFTFKYGL